MIQHDPAYEFDNLLTAEAIVIRIPGRPVYFAQTMHTAEIFARRLTDPTAPPLPTETETGHAERLYARVERQLAAITRERSFT